MSDDIKDVTVDVSDCLIVSTQKFYDLTKVWKGVDVEADYRDVKRDRPIWSIGRHRQTGNIYGSLDACFYPGTEECECVWLR